jgi:hypothetical protein
MTTCALPARAHRINLSSEGSSGMIIALFLTDITSKKGKIAVILFLDNSF